MEQTRAKRNKQLALKAFDTLFNRHDDDAAATMWSEGYIQHRTHIGPGRTGLFERVRSFPATFRYENALAVADATMWFYTGASRATVNRARWSSRTFSGSKTAVG